MSEIASLSGAERRPRVADKVADTILSMIASGRFLPGERLPGERQLAENMKVSRVSVRAALQDLKTRGYLAATQGGGTEVLSTAPKELDAPLTALLVTRPDNLHDLQELRIILESWAARRAARNAGPSDLAALRRILRQMADPRRAPRHRATDDRRFHLAIARASGSTVYNHLMTLLQEVLEEALEEMRLRDFDTREFDALILEQHRAILTAIEAGDSDAAAAAMETHLTGALAHYAKLTADATSQKDRP